MSPELATGNIIGPKSDVYGLGVVMIKIITG